MPSIKENFIRGFVLGSSLGYPVKIHHHEQPDRKKKDIAKKVCEVTFNVIGYIPVVGAVTGALRSFRPLVQYFSKGIKIAHQLAREFLVGPVSNETINKSSAFVGDMLGTIFRGLFECNSLGFVMIPLDITAVVKNKCGSMGATWGFRSVNSKTFKVEKDDIEVKDYKELYLRAKINNLFFDTLGIIPVVSLVSGTLRVVSSVYSLHQLKKQMINEDYDYSYNVDKQGITNLKCQIARGILEMSQVGIIVNLSVGILGTFVNIHNDRRNTEHNYHDEPKGHWYYTLLHVV